MENQWDLNEIINIGVLVQHKMTIFEGRAQDMICCIVKWRQGLVVLIQPKSVILEGRVSHEEQYYSWHWVWKWVSVWKLDILPRSLALETSYFRNKSLRYISVCLWVFFEENRTSFGRVIEIVRKFSANQERNVFGICLWATITEILLNTLSIYIRQALYEFLILGIGCILSDEDIYLERDNLSERNFKRMSKGYLIYEKRVLNTMTTPSEDWIGKPGYVTKCDQSFSNTHLFWPSTPASLPALHAQYISHDYFT
jgi:hypothetical protein